VALRRWASWAGWHFGVVGLIVGGLVVAVGLIPTETRIGIDSSVSIRTLPLYAKALDFIQRDSSYARLATEIVGEETSPERRTLAIFEWTRRNIRETPPDLPAFDDHVWHTIIRGYGGKDDVFTTLTMYAGVPAFWINSGDTTPHLHLSLAWIDRRWRVFDVTNGVIFRDRSGALASVEELARDPWVLESVAADRKYRGESYASFFVGFRPPIAPDILFPELQMLWPRLTYRVRRLVGLGRREWQDGR
jgi:hypothetical protein